MWGYISDHWLGANRTLSCLAFIMAASSLATALLHVSMPTLIVFAVLFVFGAVSAAFGSLRYGYAALAIPVLVCGIVLLRSRRPVEG